MPLLENQKQSYSAVLIHPNAAGGRCSGSLLLTNDGAFFQSESINHTLDLKNLSIRAGGSGNRFIFFSDKHREEITIYTADKAVLKDAVITSNPNFHKEIVSARKLLNKLLIGSLTIIAIFVVLIGGLYLLKDKMVEGLAKQVPLTWEKEAGDKLFTALSLQYKIIKNDSLKKEFLKVAAPLFKQVEQQGYKIDLYFVEDPTINAFALPGGKVIVQTGLINKAKSWEEVIGVLGHELAHVTRRHHVRSVINNIGIFTILAATLGDVSALAGTFANIGGDLASLSNSRAFETEADETGLNMLVEANMNPQGLISFFETLKKEQETELNKKMEETVDLSFLSTHPNTQERIDHLKENIKNINPQFTPLPSNFKKFREAMLNAN
ncbi:M48 family metallopeptidase [Solitalea sp. MAHUQ-68]|uniref:M48 family metallopeptidase n=1 Tax=Solitalea agri TaxID=2953739 RepID=A0A9X2JFE4_9SPHI|nr:M48 family metallopeptidase [Solitalea agri]MCO4293321.1 M48 family metallopeptidase [Solitalea agri]